MEHQVALITGAGRGIGAAVAATLGAAGWRVVLGARREADLAAVAGGIREAGGEAEFRVTDVTAPEAVRDLVELAMERFGRLDAVVANAGLAINAPLSDGDPADWDRMIDVNLRGVLHAMAAALPVLRRQGSGHVVTIGSTAATKWVPTQGVYAASKAAARAVTDVLRQELAPEGIRVSFVSPGFTDTDFIESTSDPDRLADLRDRRDAIAMPPQAVADAVAWVLRQPPGVDVGELVVRPTVQP